MSTSTLPSSPAAADWLLLSGVVDRSFIHGSELQRSCLFFVCQCHSTSSSVLIKQTRREHQPARTSRHVPWGYGYVIAPSPMCVLCPLRAMCICRQVDFICFLGDSIRDLEDVPWGVRVSLNPPQSTAYLHGFQKVIHRSSPRFDDNSANSRLQLSHI